VYQLIYNINIIISKLLFFPDEPHIALFDFQPQDYRELKLTRGELVRVTNLDSGGWAKAVNEQNKFGWVPQNFVEPCDPKKHQEIKIRTEVSPYNSL
jgi:Variant SH3 domain.